MADIVLKTVARVTDPDVAADDAPHGGFEAIASTPERDRDGDVITRKDWAALPDKVTIDVDHAMEVRGTIGSARPFFDDAGNLRISARFASTPLAQEVRTLMTEGHIDAVSVAFMREPVRKAADGEKPRKAQLELLNVGVVAIPSNRGARVLSSKAVEVEEKAGARNNSTDQKRIQAIHDTAAQLGASCDDTADREAADTGAMDGANKTADLSPDQFAQLVAAAITKASDGDGAYEPEPYEAGPGETVTCPECGKKDAPDARYCDQCGTKLEGRDDVKVSKSADRVEAKNTDAGMDDAMGRCAELAKGADAALDEAQNLIDGLDDVEGLPPEVRQVFDLVAACSQSLDELLDVMGLDDPDDPADDGGSEEEKSADGSDAESKAAKVSNKPWSGFSQADYSIEQWRRACLVKPDSPSEDKQDYKLPVREPDGTINRNAVHAAAARLNQVQDADRGEAARALLGVYRQIGDTPPDSLLQMAGEAPKKDAPKSADPEAADTKSAAAGSADEDIALRALALRSELLAL